MTIIKDREYSSPLAIAGGVAGLGMGLAAIFGKNDTQILQEIVNHTEFIVDVIMESGQNTYVTSTARQIIDSEGGDIYIEGDLTMEIKQYVQFDATLTATKDSKLIEELNQIAVQKSQVKNSKTVVEMSEDVTKQIYKDYTMLNTQIHQSTIQVATAAINSEQELNSGGGDITIKGNYSMNIDVETFIAMVLHDVMTSKITTDIIKNTNQDLDYTRKSMAELVSDFLEEKWGAIGEAMKAGIEGGTCLLNPKSCDKSGDEDGGVGGEYEEKSQMTMWIWISVVGVGVVLLFFMFQMMNKKHNQPAYGMDSRPIRRPMRRPMRRLPEYMPYM